VEGTPSAASSSCLPSFNALRPVVGDCGKGYIAENMEYEAMGESSSRRTMKILSILHDEFDFLIIKDNFRFFVAGERNWLFVFNKNDNNAFGWNVK
jgi:hypothetical protein